MCESAAHKKSPDRETRAFLPDWRPANRTPAAHALLGSSSGSGSVGSSLGSFFRSLGSVGRSVSSVGRSASSSGVSGGSRSSVSGRSSRSGFHGSSSRSFHGGSGHGSSFFLLAAGDEGSSSDHGSQNERVLHVSFPN